MKFRRALDQSLGLASYSQYTQPKATHPVLVFLTPGNESAVLLELLEQECFVQRVSSSHKPLSKRQQIWTTCYLAYVELSAAFDGVCPQLSFQLYVSLMLLSASRSDRERAPSSYPSIWRT